MVLPQRGKKERGKPGTKNARKKYADMASRGVEFQAKCQN